MTTATLEDEQCSRVVMVANSNHLRKRAYVLMFEGGLDGGGGGGWWRKVVVVVP